MCLARPDHRNFVPKLIGREENYACRAIHHLYAIPILLWTATGASCYIGLNDHTFSHTHYTFPPLLALHYDIFLLLGMYVPSVPRGMNAHECWQWQCNQQSKS